MPYTNLRKRPYWFTDKKFFCDFRVFRVIFKIFFLLLHRLTYWSCRFCSLKGATHPLTERTFLHTTKVSETTFVRTVRGFPFLLITKNKGL